MKWEYKTLDLATKGFFGGKVDHAKLESLMNNLGGEGWELVTAVSTAQGAGTTISVISIFKRPKQ